MNIVVILISIVAFLLMTLSAPLHKFGVIDLGAAFVGLKYGVYAGALAFAALVLLVAAQLILKRKLISMLGIITVLILSGIAVGVPLGMLKKGTSAPPIHDISTDLNNPPKFVAILPLRADAPNPPEYEGETSAAQQRDAYPDLKTLNYSYSKAELVAAAEQAAKNLDWDIAGVDVDQGLVEATDTTFWFGFKDDVVIRIQDRDDTRVVDIRSKSRMGASDLGKNAARIRSFIEELDEVLGE